ncbi:unnamed protein product [Blepharisma stoltei]|uniref:Uncharacterized protein n=1 Tax=Blepharisma stoltei TaxID=1481888 RepID=A0AAU9J9J9_9CILI|nr:unnamed protein product [Blepharisma stoltei]
METCSADSEMLGRLPPKSHQNNDIRTSKLAWFSAEDPYFCKYDFETWQETSYRHDFNIYYTMCMCPIPGNKLFGLSHSYDSEKSSCSVFIIDEEKINIQFIQNFSVPLTLSQRHKVEIVFLKDEENVLNTFLRVIRQTEGVGTYYNNFVYILLEDIIGFDLINQRWHTIVKSEEHHYWCSSLSFNNLILALEYEREEIYIIDLATLSVSSHSLPLTKDSEKILFKFENLVYLVDFHGILLESSIDDSFNWKIIKYFESAYSDSPYFYNAFCNNCWYMIIGDLRIYRFDLDKKKLKELDLELEQSI